MNCKECKYCKQSGKTNIQNKAGCRGGRNLYYCKNPEVLNMRDNYGYPINNFIGFGEDSYESPLKLKTNKRWCPLKGVENG